MVNPDTIRNILGIIGNVTSFLLFLSPAPTIWRIWKNKSVEEFKFHPIIAGIMNCVMWVFYSMPFVHPHSILVTTVNSLGLVMYIVFNIIYLTYADGKKRRSMSLYYIAEVIFLAALACITMLVFHTHDHRSTFVGIFCDIFGIILYGSPLTIMWKVIKTKSVEFMPPSLSLAGFLNGVVWSAYALVRFDLYILIGNGIGGILGFCQLVLYACYYSSTPKKGKGMEVEEESNIPKQPQIELSTGPHAV
ncbi:bidirectional sugar transporter SWEET4-like [Silene latifolia]|uniref:bidirectional sugar transporter SWEET4-like n=1 Tax=Silene latifolia TaxID=37657 RepID=UPI003D770029